MYIQTYSSFAPWTIWIFIDPVFLEELQFELSRLTRRTMAQTNYDAKLCYDRIIPNLAMVTSQTYGVPKSVTASNAETVLHASYHIRTDLGLAEEGYSHSSEHPIYGTGQGSGNSPAIWCFLSSVLYDCYDKVASKAAYYTPNKSEQLELGMVGFVDNSNGQTNRFLEEETENSRRQVVQQLKENAQIWTDLLSATGGPLELSKCSYHVAAWQFTGKGTPVLTTETGKYSGVTVTDKVSGSEYSL